METRPGTGEYAATNENALLEALTKKPLTPARLALYLTRDLESIHYARLPGRSLAELRHGHAGRVIRIDPHKVEHDHHRTLLLVRESIRAINEHDEIASLRAGACTEDVEGWLLLAALDYATTHPEEFRRLQRAYLLHEVLA